MKIIAHIHNDFPTKFGLPRQSGLADGLVSRIVFTPEYRDPNALRGIDGYSHLWLIWRFSETPDGAWQPTVRPPRLGGNTRVGVFASRSPFRPNPIGLSCVKLISVEKTAAEGTVLFVEGADLMDGTPIYDIKPYLPFADAHPDAIGGFADEKKEYSLALSFPDELAEIIGESKLPPLKAALKNDPRPSYQNDPERIYGFRYADFEVKFRVQDGTLYVISVEKCS